LIYLNQHMDYRHTTFIAAYIALGALPYEDSGKLTITVKVMTDATLACASLFVTPDLYAALCVATVFAFFDWIYSFPRLVFCDVIIQSLSRNVTVEFIDVS